MHSSTEHPLLEHMVGRWIMRGTIARRNIVHDVEADWVLSHHYIRIHEISREKTAEGKPEYEAMVFIGWNNPGHYSCVWLDITGGLSILSIGTAVPGENELPFVFRNEKGGVDLTNTFTYDPKDNTWEWKIDNVENGQPKPFARLRLTQAETAAQK